MSIYAPNDATQQVVFLRDLSKEFLSPYINGNLVPGGDFNCTISTLDKKGGRPIDSKKTSLNELQSLIKTHNLLDSWRFKYPDQPGFTWANLSMKIQCRLYYFLISKQLKDHDEHNEVKLSQYADDITVLLSDVQSVSKLFDLLSLFERSSGLKLNQTKSEMLWIGSMHYRKDNIFDLQMSGEPVYSLGVHFTYDPEVSEKKIFLTN